MHERLCLYGSLAWVGFVVRSATLKLCSDITYFAILPSYSKQRQLIVVRLYLCVIGDKILVRPFQLSAFSSLQSCILIPFFDCCHSCNTPLLIILQFCFYGYLTRKLCLILILFSLHPTSGRMETDNNIVGDD